MISLDVFFEEKWKNCICFIDKNIPGNIIMVYDKKYIRLKKLYSLENQEIIFEKSNNSEVLFYIDYFNNTLDVNHKIWFDIVEKYHVEKYADIKEIMLNTIEKFRHNLDYGLIKERFGFTWEQNKFMNTYHDRIDYLDKIIY